MKRLLWLLLLIPLMGCMTANQLEAEKSFYQMLTAKQAQASTPIFEMIASDSAKPMVLQNVAKVTVFAPPANTTQNLQQYVQKDYAQPWLNLFGSVASVAVPWIGAASIVNSMKDMGSVTNVTGNANKVGATNSNVVGAGNYTGHIDQTSTPTVVTQPTPIIVEQPAPVIVNPVIVK